MTTALPSTKPPLASADAATPAPIRPFVARTRALALASLVALFVLCLAWELWLAPVGRGTLAIKALPLLLPLPGLWRNRMYTYRWVSLMVWLYFTEGVVRATSDRGVSAWLASLEVLLCLALFTACAIHVRWRLRHAKEAKA
jgi:uncharacterized membrane protein